MPAYHHVTLVQPGRMAYLAGQCPLDAAGAPIGAGDVLAQARQVAATAATALPAVGTGPDAVVRSVVYVVSTEQPVLSAVWDEFPASPIAAAFTTASTRPASPISATPAISSSPHLLTPGRPAAVGVPLPEEPPSVVDGLVGAGPEVAADRGG